MTRTRIVEALNDSEIDSDVTVAGWVRTVRTSKGGFSFLTINDGSCLSCIQIVADGALANYDSEIVHMTAGTSVSVEGKLVASPAKGQRVEVHASTVSLLGAADAEH